MFAKAWVWLLCIFLSACTKAPTLIVIHTTQSWMGHIIAGVRVEPLFQGPSGQTQPAAVRTSPQLQNPVRPAPEDLRAFRFPGRFRFPGPRRALFFGLLCGDRDRFELFIGPSLAGLPIGFHAFSKLPSRCDLPPDHRRLFGRDIAGTGLALDLLREEEVRTMGCLRIALTGAGCLSALHPAFTERTSSHRLRMREGCC